MSPISNFFNLYDVLFVIRDEIATVRLTDPSPEGPSILFPRILLRQPANQAGCFICNDEETYEDLEFLINTKGHTKVRVKPQVEKKGSFVTSHENDKIL